MHAVFRPATRRCLLTVFTALVIAGLLAVPLGAATPPLQARSRARWGVAVLAQTGECPHG